MSRMFSVQMRHGNDYLQKHIPSFCPFVWASLHLQDNLSRHLLQINFTTLQQHVLNVKTTSNPRQRYDQKLVFRTSSTNAFALYYCTKTNWNAYKVLDTFKHYESLSSLTCFHQNVLSVKQTKRNEGQFGREYHMVKNSYIIALSNEMNLVSH